MYNFKSASSSFEPPMFIVFPEFCEHTHTDSHTDTQYDYHTLPPTLRGEGNKTVKITNSTVAMNNGNCNFISHVGCYDCMVTYNVHVLKLIIIQL